MARVVPQEVYEVRPSSRDAWPAIQTASVYIDARMAGSGLSGTLLAEIERYLAAHIMELSDPIATNVQLGNTRIQRQTGSLGAGLMSTRYGQMAAMLDTSGLLVTGNLQHASFLVD